MISIIIPALNESRCIQQVIAFAFRGENVSEVVVIDDGSIDATPDLAREAGARVITSTLLGKGMSMQEGMLAAHNENIVYLDGDLSGLHPDLIAKLTAPLLSDEASFVKAKFSRTAGRVTTLTAKPLLRFFFPELADLEQPLGGIIAAKRSLLKQLSFESDYGVDIGLLIDAHATGAAIAEVDIGHLEHDSQPLERLGEMASQVIRTLFDRAAKYDRFQISQVREMEEEERRIKAEDSVALEKMGKAERVALIDMDGTLLKGRYISYLALATKNTRSLGQFLDHPSMDPAERSSAIANVFAHIPQEVFTMVARDIPLMPEVVETIRELRKNGYRVGIVTDSYHLGAEVVRRRVFADFCISHVTRFQHGLSTGELTLSNAMQNPVVCTEHPVCKLNAMHYVCEKLGVTPENVLAIGDGENDICMLQAAGIGIAFHPKTDAVRNCTPHVIDGSFAEILPIVLNQTVSCSSSS